ncbi:MAG: outer membrane beta-barrel protein [Hyphomicrobium sp.]
MGAPLAGERKFVCVTLSFAAFVGVALMLAPMPAAAQILDPPLRGVEPRRPVQLRPTLPDDPPPLDEEDRRAFDDGRFGMEAATPAAAQAPQDGDTDSADPGAIGGVDDGTDDQELAPDAETRIRRVAAPQDGDPVPVIETRGPQDGLIDLTEPGVTPENEEDITAADMRSPEDIRAFVGEPGAFDPLLLAAGEINPVFGGGSFDSLAFDPFPPIGTKIGSFILYTTVEANYDFNNNLFAVPDGVGDSSLEVRPAARLASNWTRHAVEVRASGDLSFHDRFPSEDDRAYLVEGLGRLDVTSQTNFQGLIAREVAQESRSAINANTAGTRPNVVVERLRGAFNQRFNRLTTQLRGNIIDTSYSDDLINGQVVSNADRDFTLYDEAVRPKWEFSPYLFAFADIAINQREYTIPAFSDGINRSSTGERYRLGVSFGEVSQILRGNISLGYGRQTPDSRELEVIDGLLIDADLTWQVTPLTTLQFTAASEVAETTTVDSGGVMERVYGLEGRHSFNTYLVGIAGVGYLTRDFVGAGINENQFTAAVGGEYYLNRWAVLFTRYQHTAFDSSQPDSSYTVEEVQAGVRLRH